MVKETKKTAQKLPLLLGLSMLAFISVIQLGNLLSSLRDVVAQEETSQEVLGVSSDSEKFISCPGKESTDKNISFVPEHVVIEKASIDLPVMSVPLANGTWKVNSGVANFAEGTSSVSLQGGNVGLFGHDRADAFTNIKKLEVGDTVEVFASGHKAIYRVDSAEVVNSSDVNVFYATDNSTLTLVTCDGVFSQQRFAVKASLVSISELNCS